MTITNEAEATAGKLVAWLEQELSGCCSGISVTLGELYDKLAAALAAREDALDLADLAINKMQMQWSPLFDDNVTARNDAHVEGNKAALRYMQHRALAARPTPADSGEG